MKIEDLKDKLVWTWKHEIGGIFQMFKESDGDRNQKQILYRCKKCGRTETSIGLLHGHMEGHTAFYNIADVEQFIEWTERIIVQEYKVEDLENIQDGDRM